MTFSRQRRRTGVDGLEAAVIVGVDDAAAARRPGLGRAHVAEEGRHVAVGLAG